jgi:transcriptional regulator with XRE-family HTH domain
MGRNKIVETEGQIRERKRLAVMVRVLRATLGLSQRDLSLITGLSFSAVAKLEYGDIRLNPEKLRELLAVFDAAGVEYSSDDEAISVRIGSQVLERLYLRHGLSWAVDESIS